MSCATLSQGLVGLNVSMASLPEGFCPNSMQELANAIAARLVVTPNTSSSSFAIGSVPPTSNVGPWFKDCETWFKFDDATATYVPLTKQGFDNMQYFASSGTFTVPDFISKIKITAFGGGGGGQSGASTSSGGGGGAFGVAIRTVVPGQAIMIVVGSGGGTANPGLPGGATTILGMTAGGGGGAASITSPGAGGVPTGFDMGFQGQDGQGNPGGPAGPGGMGGDAGGWGGKGGAPGGSHNGTAPGGGGSGGSTFAGDTGGAGASGGVLIEW